jgi:hypothetical protein
MVCYFQKVFWESVTNTLIKTSLTTWPVFSFKTSYTLKVKMLKMYTVKYLKGYFREKSFSNKQFSISTFCCFLQEADRIQLMAVLPWSSCSFFLNYLNI